MASDYQKIKEENSENPPINYRSIFTPYSDKTHFVYELVQNADDNRSRRVGLQLCENGLLVWNDGCQFSEEDVRSICSIGFSNKDLTQIGTFGMGFKAVYTYTDIPEVYSGDERFRLPIKNPTIPEGINIDEINTRVVGLLEKGRTVFWLPFRESMRPEIEIKRLRDCLSNLEKRSLLFLRNLRTVQWYDQSNGQKGIYSCQRRPYKKMQNASSIALKASVNGNDQPSEKFLVFRKEVQPPQEVIIELQQLSEDEEERQRIQRSADTLQPVEVAFYLKDGEIKEMESCVLFAYLPTKIKTGLRFITQARYQTTLARDNIKKNEDSLWNRWLVQETAAFLPEILEHLKTGGLLKPTFFNVLPLKRDVENEFKPIAASLQKAMQEGAFVPTEKKGNFAKAQNVLYPHDELLRQLFNSNWLFPNSSWLHPKIQDKEESRRRFDVMQEAGVETVKITDILSWLEKQNVEWFEDRCNEWLLTLYTYLNKHDSQLKQIKKLPLIRLENGKHVCASSELAFFPPDTDEEREEIAPFLKELPIVKSGLLEGENIYKIEAFLKKLGVRALKPDDIISEAILPKYIHSDKPSVEQNLIHVRFLFKILGKVSKTEVKKKISETPILHAYRGFQRENMDFMLPVDAYLSQTYTDNTDLENYFSACDGEIWFVDDGYLNDESKRKDWYKFLKVIGTMDTPQRVKEDLSFSSEDSQEFNKRGLKWERSNYKQTIEDYYIEGLPGVLEKITENQNIGLSQNLWFLLVKSVPAERRQQDIFFNGTHNWYHYSHRSKTFDATFYRQLKETAWLPDDKGNLRRPSECFAPTTENRNLLGDSVAYLHTDFDISKDKETHQWLADKLGVHLNADTDSVMNYLKTLSGSTANVKDIVPLYRFLEDQGARRQDEFRAETLIFTYDPEPHWWKADEVFWEDESSVFGDCRGYLKKNYADYERTLKLFFIASGITERASPLDYVRAIQEITSLKQATDADVRKQLKLLYRSLYPFLQEGGSFLEDEELEEKWEEIREGECWLGKQGNEWGFFYSDELVWNDHQYLADIFEGKVPFWGFNDDWQEFINGLSIEGCSQAEIVVKPSGSQETDHDWSDKVRNLYPYIRAFFKSPNLCNQKDVEAAKVITQLSVCRVDGLKVTYQLKGIDRPDHNPPPSFLDENAQGTMLWIKSTVEESEYEEHISDVLQEHFNVKDLGRFAEDLLTKDRNKVLSRWERKGLQTDLCMSMAEMSPEEHYEQSTEPIDAEHIDEAHIQETNTKHDYPGMIDSDVETALPQEISKTENRDESETRTYTSRTSQARQSGGHWRNTSNRGNSTGGHSARGGGGESDEHRNLKETLAANPSLLGTGLEPGVTEYTFVSNDRADILLKDSSGNPITVEVETHIRPGDYVGAWQAVKYKHLAAVKYGLRCDQVRSILAAPEIPDDVKEKCKKLGIEPIEVPDLL